MNVKIAEHQTQTLKRCLREPLMTADTRPYAHLPEDRAPPTRRSLNLKIFITFPDRGGAFLVKLEWAGGSGLRH